MEFPADIQSPAGRAAQSGGESTPQPPKTVLPYRGLLKQNGQKEETPAPKKAQGSTVPIPASPVTPAAQSVVPLLPASAASSTTRSETKFVSRSSATPTQVTDRPGTEAEHSGKRRKQSSEEATEARHAKEGIAAPPQAREPGGGTAKSGLAPSGDRRASNSGGAVSSKLQQEIHFKAKQEAKLSQLAQLNHALSYKSELNARQLAQVQYRARQGYTAETVQSTWAPGPLFMRSALIWSAGFTNELRRLDRLSEAGLIPPPGSSEAQALAQDGSVGTAATTAAEPSAEKSQQRRGSKAGSVDSKAATSGSSTALKRAPSIYDHSTTSSTTMQAGHKKVAPMKARVAEAAMPSASSESSSSTTAAGSGGALPFLSPAESVAANAAAAAALLTYQGLNNVAAPLPAHVQAAYQLQQMQQQAGAATMITLAPSSSGAASAAQTPTAGSAASSLFSSAQSAATNTSGKGKKRKNNKGDASTTAAQTATTTTIRGPFIPIAVPSSPDLAGASTASASSSSGASSSELSSGSNVNNSFSSSFPSTLSVAIVPVTASGVPLPLPLPSALHTASSSLLLPRLNSGPLNPMSMSLGGSLAGTPSTRSASAAAFTSAASLGGGVVGISPTAFAVNASLSALSPSFVMAGSSSASGGGTGLLIGDGASAAALPSAGKKTSNKKKAAATSSSSSSSSSGHAASASSFFVSSSSSSTAAARPPVVPPPIATKAPYNNTASSSSSPQPHLLQPSPTGKTVMDRARLRVADAQDIPAIMTMIRELAAFEGEPAAVKVNEGILLRDGFGEAPVFHVLLAELPQSLAVALTAAEAVRESLASVSNVAGGSGDNSTAAGTPTAASSLSVSHHGFSLSDAATTAAASAANPVVPLHTLARFPTSILAAPSSASSSSLLPVEAHSSSTAASLASSLPLGAGYSDYEHGEAYVPVAMAFCHTAYSTWEGRVLYLEDLYVSPPFRRQGLSSLLFTALARAAQVAKCARVQWTTLKWNDGAIRAYNALGASRMGEWEIFRLYSQDIKRIAGMTSVQVEQ
jgi:Acetyltransferase (GNAT) family